MYPLVKSRVVQLPMSFNNMLDSEAPKDINIYEYIPAKVQDELLIPVNFLHIHNQCNYTNAIYNIQACIPAWSHVYTQTVHTPKQLISAIDSYFSY